MASVLFPHLPGFELGEEVVGMEEVVGPRVGAEGLAPVMVHTKQTMLVNDGQCVW